MRVYEVLSKRSPMLSMSKIAYRIKKIAKKKRKRQNFHNALIQTRYEQSTEKINLFTKLENEIFFVSRHYFLWGRI